MNSTHHTRRVEGCDFRSLQGSICKNPQIPGMTGIVSRSTDFARKTVGWPQRAETEVLPRDANKAIPRGSPGTKVTSAFGTANANISHDCVIRDQQISKNLTREN